MSGEGAARVRLVGAETVRVGIVAACWHEEVMSGLIAGAERALDDAGVVDWRLFRVPGAFELPVVAGELARTVIGADGPRPRFDAVVALGVVIRGGTPHFEYVCSAATQGLTRVALDSGVPVGFGLLTCDFVDQARMRAGFPNSVEDKGREAAEAAVATAVTLRQIRQP